MNRTARVYRRGRRETAIRAENADLRIGELACEIAERDRTIEAMTRP